LNTHANNADINGGETLRRVTLVRGRHRWLVECAAGDEAQLLRFLSDCVDDEGHPLDRMDAAIISHQLCGGVEPGLNKAPDKAD
jgi:hypothetical protein